MSAAASFLPAPRTFKLILVGEGQVGKTSLMHRFKTGGFQEHYIPTMGAEVRGYRFYTSVGEVIFNVWDTAGREEYSVLSDGYYVGADAALLMFDITDRYTYRGIPSFYDKIRAVTDEGRDERLPMVLVGNKMDCSHKVRPRFHIEKNLQYYPISVRTGLNYEKPFLFLIRKLLGDETITLIQPPSDAVISRKRKESPTREAVSHWESEMDKAFGWKLPKDSSVDPLEEAISYWIEPEDDIDA